MKNNFTAWTGVDIFRSRFGKRLRNGRVFKKNNKTASEIASTIFETISFIP